MRTCKAGAPLGGPRSWIAPSLPSSVSGLMIFLHMLFAFLLCFHLSIWCVSLCLGPLFLLTFLFCSFFSTSPISTSLSLPLIALTVSSASQDEHVELLFYMLLNTQVAHTEVCVCFVSFCALSILRWWVQFFRRLLTLSVQNSVAQIILLWLHLCVRTCWTVCVCAPVCVYSEGCAFCL